MSYNKIINRITIKKDGVYVSSKSTNDNSTFRSEKDSSLSYIYEKVGQEKLDSEVIKLALTGTKLVGNHPSIKRYRDVIEPFKSSKAYWDMQKSIENEWHKLSKEDKNSIDTKYYSDAATKYLDFKEDKINSICVLLSYRLPVNPLTYEFELSEVFGKKVLFCIDSIPSYLIPKDLFKYEASYSFELANSVLITKNTVEENFCGTIISKTSLLDEDINEMYLEEEKFKNLETAITIAEYRRLK